MKIPQNNRYILFGGSFVLANKLQVVADKTVEGLSSKQWFLLKTLQDMPDEPVPTITSLAKESDTSRQNTTKKLEALRKRKCVLIEDNQNDQRSRALKITEHGRNLLVSMRENSYDFFEKVFEGISDEECEAAAKVTIKLIDNLSKMQNEM